MIIKFQLQRLEDCLVFLRKTREKIGINLGNKIMGAIF